MLENSLLEIMRLRKKGILLLLINPIAGAMEMDSETSANRKDSNKRNIKVLCELTFIV
jgi:hypothetical protein